MANAQVGKGYVCGTCGKLYPRHPTGKKMANACCTCRECGGTSGMSYLGTVQAICQGCWEEKEWDRVVCNLATAQADYDMRAKQFNRRAPEVERRASLQSGTAEKDGNG